MLLVAKLINLLDKKKSEMKNKMSLKHKKRVGKLYP